MPCCIDALRRLFLSAATGEYGNLRARLAQHLRSAHIEVENQEIFPQTACDTVRKLGDFIRPSLAVIHIVGENPGAIASPRALSAAPVVVQAGGTAVRQPWTAALRVWRGVFAFRQGLLGLYQRRSWLQQGLLSLQQLAGALRVSAGVMRFAAQAQRFDEMA